MSVMHDEDVCYYRLDVSLSRDLSADLVEDASVVDVRADIVLSQNEAESHPGSVRGYIVRPDHGDEFDVFEACDAHSQTVNNYAVALFDPETGSLKESIDRAFRGIPYSNVLILDIIELLPAHRGQRVGLLAAWHFIDL